MIRLVWVPIINMDEPYSWVLEVSSLLQSLACLASNAYQAGGWWADCYGPD